MKTKKIREHKNVFRRSLHKRFYMKFLSFAVLSHHDRNMDRILRHHLRAGDGFEAHQPVAAQNVRQGAHVVGDEPEEAE